MGSRLSVSGDGLCVSCSVLVYDFLVLVIVLYVAGSVLFWVCVFFVSCVFCMCLVALRCRAFVSGDLFIWF